MTYLLLLLLLPRLALLFVTLQFIILLVETTDSPVEMLGTLKFPHSSVVLIAYHEYYAGTFRRGLATVL